MWMHGFDPHSNREIFFMEKKSWGQRWQHRHPGVFNKTSVFNVRPHKVDSRFIVGTFPIFQAGGRSLFIIHWPFLYIRVSHNPSIMGVACTLRRSKVTCGRLLRQDHDKFRLVSIYWVKYCGKINVFDIAVLFVYFHMIMINTVDAGC